MQNAGRGVMIAKRSLNLMLLASKSYPELIQFWHDPFPNIWPWLQGGWNGRMNENMTSGLKWSQNSTRNQLLGSWNWVLESTNKSDMKIYMFMKTIFFTLTILVIILMFTWICIKTLLLSFLARGRGCEMMWWNFRFSLLW